MRPVEQHAARPGVARKNGRQHVAGRTADVDNSIEGREIVGCSDRRGLFAMDADHRLTEQGRLLGMLREVVEKSHPLRLLEAGLAGLDGMDDLIEGTLKPTTA